MKVILLPLNTTNKNDRSYTKESFVELNSRYFIEKPNFDWSNSGNVLDLSKISGHVDNVRIEDDQIVGEFVIYNKDSDTENLTQMIENDLIVLRPRSHGFISDNGIVNKAKIISFMMIDKASDSFS